MPTLPNFCIEILSRKKLIVRAPSGSWCPAIYDGVLCWPAAPPQESVTLPCPSATENVNTINFVFKTCGNDGRWAGKVPNQPANDSFGYTDYSLCSTDRYGMQYAVTEAPGIDLFKPPEILTEETVESPDPTIVGLMSQFTMTSEYDNSYLQTTSSSNIDFTNSTLSTEELISSTKNYEITYESSILPFHGNNATLAPPITHITDYLAVYNVRNVQWCGLVTSLLAIFLVTCALIVSRRASSTMNQIRLHVLFTTVCCLLVSFLKDVYALKLDSLNTQSGSSTNLDPTFTWLTIFAQFFKTALCVWITTECLCQLLRNKLFISANEKISQSALAIPCYSLTASVIATWYLAVRYYEASHTGITFRHYSEASKLFWIVRSFHLSFILIAFMSLCANILPIKDVNNESTKCGARKSIIHAIKLVLLLFTCCFLFLPFILTPCSSPVSNARGSLTCVFFYFYGFFLSICYTLIQIAVPQSRYFMVRSSNQRHDLNLM